MKKEYTNRFKFSLVDISLLLLVSLASVAGNFPCKRVYWLSEMPVFIFAMALTMVGIIMLSFKRSENNRFRSIDRLVVIYFLYLFARAFIEYYPDAPTDRVWIVIVSLLFYWLFRNFYSLPESGYGNIIQGIVSLAAIHGIVGLFQWIALLPQYDNSQKIAGLFCNPALFGCFMAIGACLSINIILETRSRSVKYFNLSLFIIIVAGLVVSCSRTAWIAAFIPSTLIILSQYFKGKLDVRNALLLVTVLLIATIGVSFLYKMNTASIEGRMLIWKIGWSMFKDHPVFGMGYGKFYTEYGNYQADYFLSVTRPEEEILTASMNYYTFNEPLNLFIEEGIIGGLLFMILIGYSIFRALRFNDKKYKSVKVAMLSIMAVLIISGLFSYPLQDLFFNILFMICIGIIAGLGSLGEQGRKSIPVMNFRLGLIGSLLIIGIYSVIKIDAFYNWKSAKEKILISEGDALIKYKSTYSMLSNNGAFLFNYGSELADLGQFERALLILTRAARFGNSVELHMQLGKVYQSLGQSEEAERSLIKATAMNPKLFVPLSKLMLFYKETGQYEKCREIAGKIIRKPVKIPSKVVENIKKLAASNIQQL
ncbi:O-antigen ligase family protein [Sphingobacterium siyangense]|uniref:O-antigen ligase family protein n=2 Tax=Sphingobacterium siyangense TaxID=459529 RepID=UPI0030169B35